MKSSGEIQSSQGDEQTVVATSTGIVTFANRSITEGTAVRAGQTLVTISAKNLQEGDPVAKAKVAFEVAEKEYQRAERLVADKIISAKEFEQATLNYETAKNAYLAQATHVTASGVSVPAAMSGFIKQLLVSQGEYVTVGQPIATIAQNRKIQLKAYVPEREYKNLRTVNDANFKPAYDNEALYKLSALNGRLVSYGRSATENGGFIPVVFEFDNVGDLIPGSFVEVYLLSNNSTEALTVPLTAITEEQGLYFVYIQVEDEAFLKRQVTLGANDGERVEILQGVAEGEQVVTHGAYNIKLASTSTAIPHGHTH
jgi:RND family efflux transporter MFP subunit